MIIVKELDLRLFLRDLDLVHLTLTQSNKTYIMEFSEQLT